MVIDVILGRLLPRQLVRHIGTSDMSGDTCIKIPRVGQVFTYRTFVVRPLALRDEHWLFDVRHLDVRPPGVGVIKAQQRSDRLCRVRHSQSRSVFQIDARNLFCASRYRSRWWKGFVERKREENLSLAAAADERFIERKWKRNQFRKSEGRLYVLL